MSYEEYVQKGLEFGQLLTEAQLTQPSKGSTLRRVFAKLQEQPKTGRFGPESEQPRKEFFKWVTARASYGKLRGTVLQAMEDLVKGKYSGDSIPALYNMIESVVKFLEDDPYFQKHFTTAKAGRHWLDKAREAYDNQEDEETLEHLRQAANILTGLYQKMRAGRI
jgi:hypothetical protein